MCCDFLYKFCPKTSCLLEFSVALSLINMGILAKYPSLISYFNEALILFTGSRKTLKYKISWTTVYWEFSRSTWKGGHRADGQKWRSQWLLFAVLTRRLKISQRTNWSLQGRNHFQVLIIVFVLQGRRFGIAGRKKTVTEWK